MAKKKQKIGLTTAEKFETVYRSRTAVRFGDPIQPSISISESAGIPSISNTTQQPKNHLVAPAPRVALTGNETLKDLISLLKSSRHTYADAITILSAPAFSVALDAAVSQCVTHNNIGRMIILLDMLKDSQWYKPLLLWACARCGIYFRIGRRIVRNGRITTSSAMKFYNSTTSSPRAAPLDEYISVANAGTLHTVLCDQNIDKPGARKSNEWLVRLNGSFGG